MTDWNAIVREYAPMVWQTACRLLTHEADAADCFQNTFVSAVELANAEPIRNWSALLKRLATARSLELLRTRYRRVGRSESFPVVPPADPTVPDPFTVACSDELAESLRNALSTLDPQQAEVFCLVCLEGLSNADAANLLGITANHAGVLLHRARVALRERLCAFDPHREHAPGGST